MSACCLAEKDMLPQSRRPYSGGYFQRFNPKQFQKRAEKYISDITPGVVHGKLVNVREYFIIGDKRLARLVSAPIITNVAGEFQNLASQWKSETMGVSSISEIVMHPAYQLIIGMGERALPMILRDLQQNGGEWFHALHYITGRDVAAGSETVSDARAAWINWGYENNYI